DKYISRKKGVFPLDPVCSETPSEADPNFYDINSINRVISADSPAIGRLRQTVHFFDPTNEDIKNKKCERFLSLPKVSRIFIIKGKFDGTDILILIIEGKWI
ncbi:hypothetical protein JW926_09840, partial [Candidatus Sumerlaeota bacterium]|nr:hypothetical protein [Candidatus Sumerlaeota bacterium]